MTAKYFNHKRMSRIIGVMSPEYTRMPEEASKGLKGKSFEGVKNGRFASKGGGLSKTLERTPS
jgi:hypothetical protein